MRAPTDGASRGSASRSRSMPATRSGRRALAGARATASPGVAASTRRCRRDGPTARTPSPSDAHDGRRALGGRRRGGTGRRTAPGADRASSGGARPPRRGGRHRRRLVGRRGRAPRRRRRHQARAARGDGADGDSTATRARASPTSPTSASDASCRRRRRPRGLAARVTLAMASRAAPSHASPAAWRRTERSCAHGRRSSRARSDDGRRAQRDAAVLTLPPLPVGDYTLRFDDDSGSLPRRRRARSLFPAARASRMARAASASPRTSTRCGGTATRASATSRRSPRSAAATARAGGSIVGINPLHALFAEDRERASPYHPSDRRFLDPIYIDVERVPDLAASDEARALLARTDGAHRGARGERRSRLRAPSGRSKERRAGSVLRVLRPAPRRRSAGGRIRSLRRRRRRRRCGSSRSSRRSPRSIRACRGTRGRTRCADPTRAGIADFARRHARRIRFALYLQWLADRQFGAAAARRAGERARVRILSRSRGRRRAGRRRGLGESVRVRPRRVDRRAARSVLHGRPELEPAAAESRGDARVRRAPGSASCSPPTCGMRARCGSIT